MQELESDRDMRSKLNLYKITDTRATKKPSSGGAEGGMEVEGAGTCVYCVTWMMCTWAERRDSPFSCHIFQKLIPIFFISIF